MDYAFSWIQANSTAFTKGLPEEATAPYCGGQSSWNVGCENDWVKEECQAAECEAERCEARPEVDAAHLAFFSIDADAEIETQYFAESASTWDPVSESKIE